MAERIKRVVPTLETVLAAGYKEKAAKLIIQEQTDLLAAEDADPALAEAYTNQVLETQAKDAEEAKAVAAKNDTDAKASAEGEGMSNKPTVEDGVNPNAPDRPLTLPERIAVQKKALNEHRLQMAQAKADHEENIEEVGRLRKLLAHGEASIVDNAYERLSNEEHVLMGHLYALENELNSKQKGGFHS